MAGANILRSYCIPCHGAKPGGTRGETTRRQRAVYGDNNVVQWVQHRPAGNPRDKSRPVSVAKWGEQERLVDVGRHLP